MHSLYISSSRSVNEGAQRAKMTSQHSSQRLIACVFELQGPKVPLHNSVGECTCVLNGCHEACYCPLPSNPPCACPWHSRAQSRTRNAMLWIRFLLIFCIVVYLNRPGVARGGANGIVHSMHGWCWNILEWLWASSLDALVQTTLNQATCFERDALTLAFSIWGIFVSNWLNQNRRICMEFRLAARVYSRKTPQSGKRYYSPYRRVKLASGSKRFQDFLKSGLTMNLKIFSRNSAESVSICCSITLLRK